MTQMELQTAIGTRRKIQAGETIFREGEAGQQMYVLLEGKVQVYVDSEGGRIPVATFTSGDFFGEMSLLEGLPRSGTAIAAERGELQVYDEASFRERIDRDGAFAWRITKALSSRIRNHNRELIQRIGSDLQEVSALLDGSAQGISRNIEEIAASAGEIETNERQLVEQIRDVQQLSKEIISTLSFIQKVAQQTHILGLNAGIEAARSGEYGRGFKVIADEIRHLSVQSKDNAEKIADLTAQIGVKIGRVASASENSATRINKQADSTRRMVSSVGEVTELSRRLGDLAHTLKE